MPVALADDGVPIAYRVHGTGPRVLVLLHTWGAAGGYFDATVERLDGSLVTALVPDLRGHGESGKPDAELSLERVARDVLAVADDAGARTFVAGGHSMGGKLAQYLPLAAPGRVEGLVLVESAPAAALPTPELVRGWVELAGDGDAFVEGAVLPYLRRPVPRDVLRRLAEDWERIPRATLERTLRLVETSFAERLAGVEVQALVVVGAHDPLHSATADEVLACFPSARVETLDSGSEIPLEVPAELARLLESFVAGLR